MSKLITLSRAVGRPRSFTVYATFVARLRVGATVALHSSYGDSCIIAVTRNASALVDRPTVLGDVLHVTGIRQILTDDALTASQTDSRKYRVQSGEPLPCFCFYNRSDRRSFKPVTVRGGIAPLVLNGEIAEPAFRMTGTHWRVFKMENIKEAKVG